MAFRLPKGGAVPRDPSGAPGRPSRPLGGLGNRCGGRNPRSRKEALGADTTISSKKMAWRPPGGKVFKKKMIVFGPRMKPKR